MPNVGMPVVGRWEPQMYHRFMPRCSACHAPHPMARKPAVDSGLCPDCGHPAGALGAAVKVSTKGGLWLWLANKCHALAHWLIKISERI